MLLKWKRSLSTCNMFKNAVSAIFYQQMRSVHHGISGVTAGELMVIKSKGVCGDVLPPAMANVVGE